ncbi:MAG TPA: HAMP domain-containing sensor histidine kinase [Opitutaceae bacterium]|nr:HAMP domain-containing sensor histidine kinase [Opitutaceae bacterium]
MNSASIESFELPPAAPLENRAADFRLRLLVAVMLVVSAVTAIAAYFAERNLAANAGGAMQRDFQRALELLHNAQEIRHAAIEERARALERRPRIHAVLEDAPDLADLYANADIELADLLAPAGDAAGGGAHRVHAEFYRFLDRGGAAISAPPKSAAGMLTQGEESSLALRGVPVRQQLGYVWLQPRGGHAAVREIIATPIISTENGEVIAAWVLGLRPFELSAGEASGGIKSGIWLNGRVAIAGLDDTAERALATEIARALPAGFADDARDATTHWRVEIAGAPHQLFLKRLNPSSSFPPAYEVCLYPLAELHARQRQLRWQVLGAGGVLLLGGWLASRVIARRFSLPVAQLVVDSEMQRAQRARAEAALELTHEELQRSARFSADASHQLKTPVTVLRAGLEELLARENLTAEECNQVSALIHQTFRLSSLIEDLLLLSRMDAGRLKLEFAAVNLSQLIEAALDDLGAMPDDRELELETDFPPDLHIAGEKRYTSIILQNLLENARKYNQPRGRIRITARADGPLVHLVIGNTGRPIPAAAQAHIFERFHRGSIGENVPGYGLGLNLARELARLHGGDLRLARSDESGTEFEVTFQLASPAATNR